MKTCSLCGEQLSITLFRKPEHSWCRECFKQHSKQFRTTQHYKDQRRSYSLKTKYGLTDADYQKMYDGQQGNCKICHKPFPLLHIDHNHETGKVRALLCNRCNRGIGYFLESTAALLSAAIYITDYNV